MRHHFEHRTAKIKRVPERDLNAELQSLMADARAGAWARKTEFTERAYGAMERVEIVPAGAST